MNAVTVIVSAAVLAAAAFALRSIRKDRRSACSGACASCPKHCSKF